MPLVKTETPLQRHQRHLRVIQEAQNITSHEYEQWRRAYRFMRIERRPLIGRLHNLISSAWSFLTGKIL